MNPTVARWSRTGDVEGVPSVGWIVANQRCTYEHASVLRGTVIRLVERHGVAPSLLVDVVDLDGLNGIGKSWCNRRKNARRAQRILREFHGVTA